MKTFILAVLVITIIHLTIRYLLQSNLLYKSKQIVSSTMLEEMFTTNKKNDSEEKETGTKESEETDKDEEDTEENDYDLKNERGINGLYCWR